MIQENNRGIRISEASVNTPQVPDATGLVPLTVHSWFRGGLSHDFKNQIWKHISECGNLPSSSIQLKSFKGEMSMAKKCKEGETSTVKKSKEGETSIVKKRKDGEKSTVKKRKKVIDVVQENMSASQNCNCYTGLMKRKKLLRMLIFSQLIRPKKYIVFPLVMDAGMFGFVKCLRTFHCIGQP